MSEIGLTELGEIGQLIAGVASLVVVITVILLWKQIKQQVQDSRTELITGMTTLIVSVSQVFVEHPTMRKYFHEGATPTGEAREQATAIAVTMADAMDHVAAHLKLMERAAAEAWTAYFKGIYGKSPILKEYLSAHASWYGPALRGQLELP